MSERSVRVAKFGGSIIGTGSRLARAAERLERERADVTIAVASAPGGLTDELLRIAGPGAGGVEPREQARILAAGEVLGATLLAGALRSRGMSVELVLPERPEWPVRLTSSPRDASVDLAESEPRFRELVARSPTGSVLVLPGFVGLDPRGTLGTLPRGGGDTTAIVAARALDLREVLLVKDVPGVLDADPRVDATARPLRQLSVGELALLSNGGARVVAEDALRYVPPDLTIRVVGIESAPHDPGTEVDARRGGPRLRAAEAGDRPTNPRWALITGLAPVGGSPPGEGGPLPPPSGWVWIAPLEEAPDLVRRLRASGVVRAVTYRALDPLSDAVREPGGRPSASARHDGEPIEESR